MNMMQHSFLNVSQVTFSMAAALGMKDLTADYHLFQATCPLWATGGGWLAHVKKSSDGKTQQFPLEFDGKWGFLWEFLGKNQQLFQKIRFL